MVEAMLNIGETLGFVTIPKDSGEMKGGSFMKVTVEVDITKPLCRGRKISWDQDYEGWVAFKCRAMKIRGSLNRIHEWHVVLNPGQLYVHRQLLRRMIINEEDNAHSNGSYYDGCKGEYGS
nr:hypothetical protein CFP56_20088 [Quercus suber]